MLADPGLINRKTGGNRVKAMSFRKKLKIGKDKQSFDETEESTGENLDMTADQQDTDSEALHNETEHSEDRVESEAITEEAGEASLQADGEAVAHELREQVEALSVERDELKAKYIRALADFENYKKRAMKERSDVLKYQGEKILADIVQVVDNLELALGHKDAEPEKLVTGLEMIHRQFVDTLGRWDVRQKSVLGQPFDPNTQNALSKIPVADTEPGTVVNEFKKAYFYKDKLLRAAEVVVSEPAPEPAPKSAEEEPADGDVPVEN